MRYSKMMGVLLCVWILSCCAWSVDEPVALKEVFTEDFLIGTALNTGQVFNELPAETMLIKTHFNSITPENLLKWEKVHPSPGRYDFESADAFVNLGQQHNMSVIGHTLVWHSQTPGWVFKDAEGKPLSRDTLLARMKDHIFTVVGRYKGHIHGWDVVNEAVDDDGTLRKTKWLEIIGDDYVAKAFEYVHAADPDAELYYNDYDMWKKDHRDGVVRLVKDLQSRGLRVDGIGMQGHWGLDYPPLNEIADSINAYAALGVKVMITEMEITVLPSPWKDWGADITKSYKLEKELNPYPNGLPETMHEKLAARYAEFFSLFHKHADKISRVTFWGVQDGNSWRNNWPVRGRTDYPLIFDRNCEPKRAFGAVIAIPQADAGTPPPVSRTFTNPVISGFHPDPSICRVEDDYYTVHSTFEYFPGVPIFHSRDLVHWRQIGHCLTRESQLPLEKMRASGGIFAPTLRYHDGTFYMITTNVYGGGNFYVSANDPAGPWSEPVWLDNQGIDPSLFFDDDGKVYYTRHVGGGDGYIGQCEIDIKSGKLKGQLQNIWGGTGGVWAEGPHLYKINGTYFLMISEGGTSYDHMVTIARSDSPFGPFESNPDNPILTHRNRPGHPIQALGHADLVESSDGWWMVCLGIRPQGGNLHHLGRETFLTPVVWNDDNWPVVNGNGTLELVMPAPSLASHPFKERPARDDFDNEILDMQWNFLRNPYDVDHSLSARPGYLRLHGSAVTLNDQDSPAFVGRRQMDLTCRISVKLDFKPAAENEEAGLVLRGNEGNHYDMAITKRQGKRKVFLRKIMSSKTVEPVFYADIPDGDLILLIEASPLEYTFSCRGGNGSEISLGSAFTRDLSSEKIGGFTGVYCGLYASGNGSKNKAPADFDWFDYLAK